MRIFIVVVVFVLIEIYSFQLIRTLSRDHWWKWIYLFISLAVIANVMIQFSLNSDRSAVVPARDFATTLFLSFFAVKAVFIFFMLSEDLYRLFRASVIWITEKVINSSSGLSNTAYFEGRRAFISKVGLAVAALPFGALLYGAWKGKYNYQVRSYELTFDDLPDAFDGYKITQLSDIHVGSFEDRKEVEYAVDLANEQGSDAIFFTGDLVNNVASEMYGWEDIFGSLKAKDGIYSVLGNHDYGDYVRWDSPDLKKKNLEELQSIQEKMGWRLLMDEHKKITRGDDQLAVVGVQNWGGGRCPKYGNLDKASEGLSEKDFKILLSHDPTHWDLQVKERDLNYHLTLSGHTHGMQFGIEIPGFIKLSPAWFVYKKWAGIYKEYGRFLNVNRGFGFLGYKGRAGIWPEITVITLRKKSK